MALPGSFARESCHYNMALIISKIRCTNVNVKFQYARCHWLMIEKLFNFFWLFKTSLYLDWNLLHYLQNYMTLIAPFVKIRYHGWYKLTRCVSKLRIIFRFKDSHREKAPSNKTPALRKTTNWALGVWGVDIKKYELRVWAVGTLNQLFIRGS